MDDSRACEPICRDCGQAVVSHWECPQGDGLLGPCARADAAEAALEAAIEARDRFITKYGAERLGLIAARALADELAEAAQAVLDWYEPEQWAGPHDWLKEVLAKWEASR